MDMSWFTLWMTDPESSSEGLYDLSDMPVITERMVTEHLQNILFLFEFSFEHR